MKMRNGGARPGPIRPADEEPAAMVPVFEYVHAIDGRLRVKVPEVRRSPAHARRVEARFGAVAGIREVRANPVTGNVLFLHDPDRVAAREILAALIAAGYLGMGLDGAGARPGGAVEVAEAVADLLTWALMRAWKGFGPGPEILGRLVEVAARFLLRLALGRAAVAPA